jgi:hypothetical protein
LTAVLEQRVAVYLRIRLRLWLKMFEDFISETARMVSHFIADRAIRENGHREDKPFPRHCESKQELLQTT